MACRLFSQGLGDNRFYILKGLLKKRKKRRCDLDPKHFLSGPLQQVLLTIALDKDV